MKFKNIFYAPFVNAGGGRKILLDLLSQLKKNPDFLIILDKRIENKINKEHFDNLIFLKPNFFDFIKKEIYIYLHSDSKTKILCFHGAPTFFKNPGKVKVFFQNRLYVTKDENFFNFKSAVKKYFYTASFDFCDEIIVQTKSMKSEIFSVLQAQGIKKNISIHPVISLKKCSSNKIFRRKYDFIYVADALKHKNHLNLINAWALLAKDGFFPSLVLVIPNYDKLIFTQIKKLIVDHKLNVILSDIMEHSELVILYNKTRALIYPSLTESFGLPLIEANFFNLPILASELDFVREVCRPVETFNPLSPLSISLSVKRFMNLKDNGIQFETPQFFIDCIFNE